MSKNRLSTDLAELRAEIDRLPADAPARERLLALARRIEAQIDDTAQDDAQDSLIDGAKEAAAEFEVDHPHTAGLLRRIINTLSSMGI